MIATQMVSVPDPGYTPAPPGYVLAPPGYVPAPPRYVPAPLGYINAPPGYVNYAYPPGYSSPQSHQPSGWVPVPQAVPQASITTAAEAGKANM